jgi:demethylmenaquinone methyltransferase/2-methoxy-6-polyprenyl-1,4-benzoquinol methylase
MVLDLACGTGDITFALGKELDSGRAIGLDITQEMLVIAEQKKLATKNHKVHFERSDIMRLPFPDQSFDRVTGGYALRNVPDIPGALTEIMRVLKPGGRLLSLDFGKPKLGAYRWLYLKYLIIVGSALGLVLHGDPDTYRYIPESLKLYPGQYEIKNLMKQAGYIDNGHIDFMGGIMAVNWGRKPKR